jgi:RNA polymerase sigma-70 factor (ECF subfamily)
MVEELVQATLVTAYQHLGSYRPEGTFLAWLKGIGRNLMLKEVQRRERAPAADSDLLDRLALEAALPPETGDEEEEAANLDRLRRCLEKLPEPAWQIVQLRYFEKQSIREIAAATGRTETAVAVNLFRIRQDLRDCMLGGTGHE